MSEIIILIGPPGSGKTTYTNHFLNENKGWVAVGRDKIREQLFGYTESNIQYYWEDKGNLSGNEKIVTRVLYNNIRFLLSDGFNVIIDNTHLKSDHIKPLLQEFSECKFTFKIMGTSLKDCLERDKNRGRSVGEEIIKNGWESFLNIKTLYSHNYVIEPVTTKVQQDLSLPKAIIFDIDGTLSNSTHRHIFTDVDEEILEDKVIEEVRFILKQSNGINQVGMSDYIETLFVSGRSEKYRGITERWLQEKVGVNNPKLLMRRDDDQRKDTIVKEEIFKEISKTNYILFAVDDRLSVTRHLRKLGYFVFNVNQLDKEF